MEIRVVKCYSEATAEQYLYEFENWLTPDKKLDALEKFSREDATPNQKEALRLIMQRLEKN